jgi:hypothetical protein
VSWSTAFALGILLLTSCTFNTSGLSPAASGTRESGPGEGIGAAEGLSDGATVDARSLELAVPRAERGLDQKLALDLPGCPTTCLLGCPSGSTTCRKHTPSNVGAVASLTPCAPATSAITSTINTTTCTLSSCQGLLIAAGKLCAIRVASLTIPAGATLRAEGDSGLVILSDGDVIIDGTLDGAGQGTQPGAGGGAGGVPTGATSPSAGKCPGGLATCNGQGKLCSGCTSDDCGGGGGGYGAAGGDGGLDGSGASCSTLPKGGMPYGNAELVPLLAGSGGASGSNTSTGDPAPAAGGGGGGAIQVSAQGVIRIDGVINAGGAGGIAGVSGGGCGNGGGGGGSGGAVLLEAPQILGSGWVTVNGGGGGGGAYGSNAKPGEPGHSDDKAAKGGAGSGGAGAGGAGGTSTLPPVKGTSAAEAGGGGGGSAGRIRLNWDPIYKAPTLKLSGFSSTGALKVP